MYCEFFGLTAAPFNNTPDPRFFFNTPDHEEALASLHYAVEQRKGFVLVTGEVGSGKTLLSRLLLNRLGSHVRTAVITNTRLTAFELLRAVCREFELQVDHCKSAAELTHELEQFLIEQYSRGRLAVVILDEAQNLPVESLEELRMLGNLEADDAKLLQILILGQPELQQKIRQPSLRQTFQRFFRTFHLRALDESLTEGYIRHRLKIAGCPGDAQVFSDDAIDAIKKHSGGVPRVINQICDNAMLAAYSESKNIVTAEYVEEIVHHMLSVPPGAGGAEIEQVHPMAQDRFDERIQDMTGKLNAFEEKLKGISQHLAQARSAAISAEERASASAATAVQQRTVLEERTRQLLEEAERNIQTLLAGAKKTALTMEERAATSVAELQKQNVALRDKTAALLGEVETITNGQRRSVEQVVRDGRDEIEAVRRMRQESAALLQRATEAQQQLEGRLARALEEAEQASSRIESRAGEFLEQARTESKAAQQRLDDLLKQVREKGEASQHRAGELLSQQRADLETSRRQFDEFSAELRERSERMDREREAGLNEFKDEVKQIVEQIHAVRDRTEARAGEVITTLDQLITDSRERMTSSQTGFDALVKQAEEKIGEATLTLASAKDRLVAEASESRQDAQKCLELANRLLDDTRTRCEAVLAKLHEQVTLKTKQAEQIWKNSAAEGAKTLSELNSALAEARQKSGDARSELEAIIQTAARQMDDAKSAIGTGLRSHQTEVDRLVQQADALKSSFQQRFATVASEIDALFTKREEAARRQTAGLAAEIDAKTSEARAEAAARIEALQSELRSAGELAGSLCDGVKNAIETTRGQASECQAQFERESEAIQRRLVELFERNQAALRSTKTQVEALSNRALRTGEDMQSNIDGIERSARQTLVEMSKDFEMLLAVTAKRAETLRQESEAASANLAQRLNQTAEDAAKAVAQSQEAAGMVRQQSARSLAEVRDCLSQMHDKSEELRRDLVKIGDEVLASSTATVEQVEKCGRRTIEQIDTMRKAARSDAEANAGRLAALKQQVEQSAEQMRSNAARLLDQVQAGAAAVREHAETLLAEAQCGSEKINASASKMLLQAQTASERFREQAQGLLHKSEAVSAEIRREVQSLRTDVAGEAEQIREQIGSAQRELSETRRETAENAMKATDAQKRAQADADRLLAKAQAVHAEAEGLLAMPKQLVDEAKAQAQSLAEMSKKISTVVKQLSTAGASARENREALEHAGEDAERKIELLKRHTERVGQLVGIIRQLYGTMDARIARLRGRLMEADDLFREVPREIESLRSVLDSETRISLNDEPPAQKTASIRAQPRNGGSTASVSRAAKPAAGAPKSSVLSSHQRLKSAKGSLGEIVQRNRKLNEWLQNVLGDEALSAKPAPTPDRSGATPETPATKK